MINDMSKMYYLTLKCLGYHQVVEFWSKEQIINFQTFIEDTPSTRCLS